MKRLLIATLLGLTAASGISWAAICQDVKSQRNYYDCATGVWCGATDYHCFGPPTVVGCVTQCSTLTVASCQCRRPAPGQANSAVTPDLLDDASCQTAGNNADAQFLATLQ